MYPGTAPHDPAQATAKDFACFHCGSTDHVKKNCPTTGNRTGGAAGQCTRCGGAHEASHCFYSVPSASSRGGKVEVRRLVSRALCVYCTHCSL